MALDEKKDVDKYIYLSSLSLFLCKGDAGLLWLEDTEGFSCDLLTLPGHLVVDKLVSLGD